MDGLVGRDEELETLDRLIAEAGEGEFRLLQVEGEPGIGKSRLLDELADRTDGGGWLVRRGSAAEFESELPFGPVIDALDPYLTALDPQSVNRLGSETTEVLAEVFPALASRRNKDRGPAIASERFRIHIAIRELLERLSGRAPLALILDDVHWADQASIELIGYLLRRPPQAAIMVAVGNRSGKLDPNLAATIATSRGPVAQIQLAPLTLAQTATLIGVSERLAEPTFRETGGNPFFALELARAGLEPGSGGPVPETVSAALSAEAGALSPGTRRFAEAAAVAGDPFDIDLVDLIVGDGCEATASIDELASGDLVRPTEVPRRFRFRHSLVRSAIYQSVMPGTRLADHGRAAHALAGMDAPAAEQARHLVLAARPGDSDAARVIGEAAAGAQASAPTLAATWSDAALRIMPSGEVDFRLAMLTIRAQATAAAGRFEEARASLLQAIDLLEEDQVEQRVSLTSACASMEDLMGQHEVAHSRLTGLLAALEDQGSPQAVEVMLNLARDAFLRNDAESMTQWSERALEAVLADEPVDQHLLVMAKATRAICASFTGPISLARQCADDATAIFDTFDQESLDRTVFGMALLCGADLYLERFEETIKHGQIAIESSRRTGQGQNFPMLYPCIGTAGVTNGNFEIARSVLDDAIDSARISNNVQSLAWSLFNRAMLAQAEGDIPMAEQLCSESVELLEDQDDGLIKTWAGVLRGGSIIAAGRLEEGLAVLLDAAGGEGLPEIPGSWRVWFLAIETETLIALGRIEEAEQVCGIAEERSKEFDNEMSASQALRARASLDIALGNPEEAIGHARRAIDLAGAVDAKTEVFDDRIVLAEALRAAGQESEAITELETVREGAIELGAERHRKLAEQKLRALGRRIHRRSGPPAGDTGVESLTGREREVTELVVDRRTNREIAEALFLSQKTVETHLRNIFGKLGVTSRVEVARAFEEQST